MPDEDGAILKLWLMGVKLIASQRSSCYDAPAFINNLVTSTGGRV